MAKKKKKDETVATPDPFGDLAGLEPKAEEEWSFDPADMTFPEEPTAPPAEKPKRRKRAADVDLPEMSSFTNEELDQVCSGLSDCRHEKNELETAEVQLKTVGAQLLKDHGRMTYAAHGIRLTLVPGVESISVRLVKGAKKADAE